MIAYNGAAGVVILGSSSTGNSIRGNSIFANAGLGIDLGDDGVTPNGPAPQTGPNDLENYPGIASFQTGATTRVSGSLNSLPNTAFTLDFYANQALDPSGFGQGQLAGLVRSEYRFEWECGFRRRAQCRHGRRGVDHRHGHRSVRQYVGVLRAAPHRGCRRPLYSPGGRERSC